MQRIQFLDKSFDNESILKEEIKVDYLKLDLLDFCNEET
jgi:hypothetical protein